MRARALLLAALAGGLVVVPAAGAAEPAYGDPWSPAAVAAAEAAAARLGDRRSLGLRSSVLTIPGLTVGFGGGSTGIVASVQELRQALRELAAEETALTVRVELPADVLFDFDAAEIRADAATALARLATVIAAYPEGRVELSGHTDAQGADAYNQRLSERRAQAVQAWLVQRHGVARGRIAARGEGESRPVADNGTAEGRQRNRRVEAVVHKSAG